MADWMTSALAAWWVTPAVTAWAAWVILGTAVAIWDTYFNRERSRD